LKTECSWQWETLPRTASHERELESRASSKHGAGRSGGLHLTLLHLVWHRKTEELLAAGEKKKIPSPDRSHQVYKVSDPVFIYRSVVVGKTNIDTNNITREIIQHRNPRPRPPTSPVRDSLPPPFPLGGQTDCFVLLFVLPSRPIFLRVRSPRIYSVYPGMHCLVKVVPCRCEDLSTSTTHSR
jgi:hypothetical protein